MRAILLLLGFLLSPALLAQSADLAVTAVTIGKTTLATGEPFSFTVRVRNNGPQAATNVLVRLGGSTGQLPVTIEAPAGWTCRRYVSDQAAGTCTTTTLANGAEAEFRGTMLAPRNTASFAMVMFARITATTPDPREADNIAETRFTHAAAANVADLSAIVTTPGGTREGERGTVDVAITNHGPAAAQNVVVAVDTRDETPLTDPVAEGSGWTCTNSLQGLLCRTAALAAGATSTFAVHFTAPDHEALIGIAAFPQAELSRDPNFRNDLGVGYAGVGSAENWRRILLPLAAPYVPGANGAAWTTRTTMLIRSTEDIEISPGPCDRPVDPCIGLDLQRPFDAAPLIYTDRPGGQFLYVRPENEAKLRFNTRIWDNARFTETAGAEIPVVREDELITTSVSLLGIPVAPQYRHTLRVYDADARENARVLIHVYANHEATPRVSVVRTLERSPEMFHVTSALLPTHPSYLEIDPRSLTSLDGLETIRIEVEPVDPGLRFWAFVSITNNETHHVTTVTPQ